MFAGNWTTGMPRTIWLRERRTTGMPGNMFLVKGQSTGKHFRKHVANRLNTLLVKGQNTGKHFRKTVLPIKVLPKLHKAQVHAHLAPFHVVRRPKLQNAHAHAHLLR